MKSLDSGVHSRGHTGLGVRSNLSSCCAPSGCPSDNTVFCPVSGTKGAKVDLQTVKAMLTEPGLRRFAPVLHRFCPDPSCDVVYFAEDGQTYAKADVRVAVWQKEPEGGRTICYCFGENEAEIRAEVIATGTSIAVERVRQHIQAGRCACEVRNPRGVCCLGELGAAVKRLAATLAAPVERHDKTRECLGIQ